MDAGLGGGAADDADRLAGAFAGAGVGLGALAADGKAAQVPDAAIAFDGLKAFEVHADFAAEIAFDGVFAVLNSVNDLGELGFREILGADARIDVGSSEDIFRVAGADAVNVTQRDFDALVGGNFYSDDAGHVLVK